MDAATTFGADSTVSTTRIKPAPLCYTMFDALMNSAGNKKPLSDSPEGIAILEAPPETQAGLVMICFEKMHDPRFAYSFSVVPTVRTICSDLCAKQLPYTHGDMIYILDYAITSMVQYAANPPTLATIVTMADVHLQHRGTNEEIRARLETLAVQVARTASTAPIKRLVDKIRALNAGNSKLSVTIIPDEAWSNAAIEDLAAMNADEQGKWNRLLAHASQLTATNPSKKWLSQAEPLLQAIGTDNFQRLVGKWFSLIGKRGTIAGEPGVWEADRNELIGPTNADLLKGLIWFASFCPNDEMAKALGTTAEACFKKIRNHGPRNPKLANACTSVLSTMMFKEAVAQLSRLKSGAKGASSRKQLEKSLGSAAEKSGMSVADLEELSVPDFGFTEVGKLDKTFADYEVQIFIAGPHEVAQQWRDKTGKPLNSVPAAVKRDFADEVKTLKKTGAEIEKLLPSIRHRIESSLLHQRHWNYKSWRERYLDHPIAGALARKLLWNFNGTAGIWCQGNIVDQHGTILAPADEDLVELWHPIGSQSADVLAWRHWLANHSITQPFKQAHREIYVLTDAERQTATYSNRFAAHIMRQHQFAELAKQRGWQYRLQGQWDSANTPELELPQWNMRVEFWVDPAGEETSGAGIYMNLSTDQVRFSRLNNREPINLTEIMPIVFTEVMRDVDLFVGVCSIGNDPNWQEGRHQEYWQSFSFGDLGASANTRKEVLQSIVPHLKIGSRCSFTDKFLVVKGDLRTYNIHLGSGNVMMEPNGQYLCIVSARGDQELAPKIFLPFEGDRTLSIILSKCLLLAEDSKIKDQSILSQIQRK